MSDRQAKAVMRRLMGSNRILSQGSKLYVRCLNGSFIGRRNGNAVSFKGIPYALPPVGELRWKAPVPCPENDSIREAFYFAPSPIQTEISSERGSLYTQSEDCLYLNIWLNSENRSTKKPVMFFIHGGSYGWGACSDPLYDGTNLVTKFDDIILVTAEYRTGIMGFMDFSSVDGGTDYPDSANLGLLDQIAALKWVHDNIAFFGGDPDNVTVFGESAGGGSVSLLAIMPMAKGLFKRVIAESGSVALTYSRDECARLTDMLLKVSGCTSMSELAALSEARLKRINKELNEYNNFPMRDGRIVPFDPYSEYENGVSADIELMIGTNADECRYWINELPGYEAYALALPVLVQNYMRLMDDDERENARQFMDSLDMRSVWKNTELLNELLFRVPALKQAELHGNAGGKAYVYYWKYPSALPHLGACHAVELAYVFNNPDETIYTGNNIDMHLADTVQRMWVSFARTGKPCANALEWSEYGVTRETMIFDSKVHIESDPLESQRFLIEPLLPHYFNGCYTNLNYDIPYVHHAAGQLLLTFAAAAAAVTTLVLLLRKSEGKNQQKEI